MTSVYFVELDAYKLIQEVGGIDTPINRTHKLFPIVYESFQFIDCFKLIKIHSFHSQ